jgi:hypothetical protein
VVSLLGDWRPTGRGCGLLAPCPGSYKGGLAQGRSLVTIPLFPVCAKSAQKSADSAQPAHKRCQPAGHGRRMVKIITVQFQRSRLPRRRLNDGWWLEQPPARPPPSSLSQSAACRSPSANPATSPSISRPHLAIKPDHIAENIPVAISWVASTRGITLLPLYAQNLLPKTVVSRPIRGTPPMIDLVIGCSEANTPPLLKFLLSKVDELKFRVSKNDGR